MDDMNRISRYSAAVLSLLCPGAGSAACGRRISGILFLAGSIIPLAAAGIRFLNPGASGILPAVAFGIALTVWLTSVSHAWTCAGQQLQEGTARAASGVLINLLVPGLGHYLCGAWMSGLGFFLGWAVLAAARIHGPGWMPGPRWFGPSTVIAAALGLLTAASAAHLLLTRSKLPAKARIPALGAAVFSCVLILGIKLALTVLPVPDNYLQPTLLPGRLLPDDRADLGQGAPAMSDLLVRGERLVAFYAQDEGTIDEEHEALPERFIFFLNERPVSIPADFTVHVHPGSEISKGQLWASALRKAGDHVLVNRFAYTFSPPRRGDLVLVQRSAIDLSDPLQRGYTLLRVAGLPGDTVKIQAPSIYINGEKLRDPVIFADIAAGKDGYRGFDVASPINFPPPRMTTHDDVMTVGDNEVFLVGDFPPVARDSRFTGPVPLDRIKGRVVRILWPGDRSGRALKQR